MLTLQTTSSLNFLRDQWHGANWALSSKRRPKIVSLLEAKPVSCLYSIDSRRCLEVWWLPEIAWSEGQPLCICWTKYAEAATQLQPSEQTGPELTPLYQPLSQCKVVQTSIVHQGTISAPIAPQIQKHLHFQRKVSTFGEVFGSSPSHLSFVFVASNWVPRVAMAVGIEKLAVERPSPVQRFVQHSAAENASCLQHLET